MSEHPSVPIADTPDALTPAWLTTALDAAGLLDGAAVTDVAAMPIGTGQMSDSIRLELTYDRAVPLGTPASVIAKLPAADPTSRATGLQMRSYEIEVRFYQQLAPELPMRTPRCHHSAIDVTTGSFVLLLEDLRPARQGDQLAGCSVEQAILAVDELVGLHAPRWGDDRLAELDWLHRDPEQRDAMALTLLPMLWSGFQDRYVDHLGPEVHEVGRGLFAALDRYVGGTPEPWTVVHGDYRLDNLLFGVGAEGGNAGGVAVVDWQTCAYGPALADVAYFIGAGLLAADRREAELDVVRRYHEGLLAAGVDGYEWDRCWTDHRRGTFAGLIMAIGASMLVERTERGDEMFMAMAHRHARHALDLDALALLG